MAKETDIIQMVNKFFQHLKYEWHNYIILISLFIIELVMVILVVQPGKDLSKLFNWLIGINLTIAFFSVNLTFFGHQLSKYKTIYKGIAPRQWFNIVLVLLLPFLPIFSYLILPQFTEKIALLLLPIILLTSIDNAMLTWQYLDPTWFLKANLSDAKMHAYLQELYKLISVDTIAHEKFLENAKRFQIPFHEWYFMPDTLGSNTNDLWDNVVVLLKATIVNNDIGLFSACFDKALLIAKLSYSFKSKEKDDYKILDGIKHVSHIRIKSIIKYICLKDSDGFFLDVLVSKLCKCLSEAECLNDPLGSLPSNTIDDLTGLSKQIMKTTEKDHLALRILASIHIFAEKSVDKFSTERTNGTESFLDEYNVSSYVKNLESLGKVAAEIDNGHLVYRCIETISYLGCNAASKKSRETTISCLESLVQLGRISRHNHTKCFWSHCMIPLHSHAEAHMGYILTWLVKDIDQKGQFYLKEQAEEAFSRLRGIQCEIKPDLKWNPVFWIKEVKDAHDKPVPFVDSMSDKDGYHGQIDYSDFSELKDFKIH